MRWLLILLLLAWTHTAFASVTITEVAWMGDSTSADNEWIELHNGGSESISLSEWKLVVTNWSTDEESFTIPLSGSLPSSAFGVLERSDDESADGVAHLFYTGALVNTGATLSLYDAQGDLMDRVAGGDAWEHIKGDNVSKKTAQKTSNGWVSATASPGRSTPAGAQQDDEKEVGETEDDEDQNEEKDTKSDDETDPVTIELTLPDTELIISAVLPSRAYVNQDIVLSAEATGVGRTLLNSLTYTWNFGDLSTAEGKEVSHTYTHPGQYVVTLTASFGRHSDMARSIITVLPVSFTLSWSSDGVLHIHNDARYEVDMSGYRLVVGEPITFPEGTILLPSATLTLTPQRLGVHPHSYGTLYDQEGSIVATTVQRQRPQIQTESPPVVVSALTPTPLVTRMREDVPQTGESQSNFSFSTEVIEDTEEMKQQPVMAIEPQEQVASIQKAQSTQKSVQWPYMALVGVLCVGCVAILTARIR